VFYIEDVRKFLNSFKVLCGATHHHWLLTITRSSINSLALIIE
jgi:hypothetical protein